MRGDWVVPKCGRKLYICGFKQPVYLSHAKNSPECMPDSSVNGSQRPGDVSSVTGGQRTHTRVHVFMRATHSFPLPSSAWRCVGGKHNVARRSRCVAAPTRRQDRTHLCALRACVPARCRASCCAVQCCRISCGVHRRDERVRLAGTTLRCANARSGPCYLLCAARLPLRKRCPARCVHK